MTICNMATAVKGKEQMAKINFGIMSVILLRFSQSKLSSVLKTQSFQNVQTTMMVIGFEVKIQYCYNRERGCGRIYRVAYKV